MSALEQPENSENPRSVGKRDRLEGHRKELEDERCRCRASEVRWSWARLVTFAGVVLPWLFSPGGAAARLLTSAVMLGLFVWSVRRNRSRRGKREFAERRLVVIGEALRRCDGQVALIRSWQRPEDPTNELEQLDPILEAGVTWPLTDQERDDLDIHAPPVGMFALLNRTSAVIGARRLRDMIDHPCLETERIRSRQRAVRWLDDHPIERLKMMGALCLLRERDEWLDRLVRALRQASPLPPSMLPAMWSAWGWISGFVALVAVGAVALGHYGWGTVVFWLLLVNGVVFWRMRKELEPRLRPWRNLVPTLRGYLAVAGEASRDLPDKTDLSRLRDCFTPVVRHEVLPSLCGRAGWSDTGGLFHVLCNLLFFYDLQVARAILRCVLPHRDELIRGLSATGDLEALLSLACFAWEQPVTCYPEPSAEPGFAIEAGTHPLIAPERVVANDVHLGCTNRMWIITGSNMSGKSTLLRMVGLNVLLAQVGSVACARRMRSAPMRLMTDLRVRDNLSEQESYYLAEVRHLRRMVVPPAGAAPVLGLIDEPHRGTNSREQAAAGVAVCLHLLDSAHFFLVATHSEDLAGLADASGAHNYHFSERLETDGLVFDYSLQPGPARTRNAIRVLEREGYPAAVLERAREWLRQAEDRDHATR